MPVKASVASGANALALLPPHAQRGLVLVVGIGAGKSTEGTVSPQEPLAHSSLFLAKIGGGWGHPGKVSEQVHLPLALPQLLSLKKCYQAI